MPYRFAILGCGNISRRHAAAIKSSGSLVAACDIIENKAVSLAHEYGAVPYLDLDSMLAAENPDVVVVCTPNGLHAKHVMRSLKSGSHVLCEKPLSLTTNSGSQMVQEAAACGKRLFVVKQNRYNPPVVAVKALLEERKLGRVHGFQINCFWNRPASYYSESWRGKITMDGGTLFTQFSHFIDLLYWFLGEIDQVSGWRANFCHRHIIEFEDMGVANIIMKNGAVGNLHYSINSHESNLEGSITLFGEKGTVKIGGQYLNTMEHFSVKHESAPLVNSAQPPNIYGQYQGSMSNHAIVYEELIKALGDPEHAFVEAAEALKSVEMITQIYKASPFITVNH